MARATLGGFPILSSSTVGWTLREGTAASTETFDMRPAYAQQLLALAGKPVDLVYKVNGREVTVKNIYVLHAAPQDQPQIAKVTVADRRWLWQQKRILRRYNMRRNVGVVRNEAAGAQALGQVDPAVRYWPWSVKGDPATPWQAKEVLADVMERAGMAEQEWAGVPMPWVDETPASVNQMPFENFELMGDVVSVAISRVLAYLPGIGITVREDGTVAVFDKTAGGEMDVVKSLGGEVRGHGHVTLIDNRILRPRRVVVKFQREVEWRGDYTETSSTGTVAQQALDARYLDNVGVVTDPTLPVGGVNYPAGSYLTFDQLFGSSAWTRSDGFTVGHDLVQRAFCPWFDLWADIVGTGEFDPAADWAGRVGMIMRDYRQTFRISARWMARFLSIRAYRLATVNQTTGSRAPALVVADHAYMPSMRGRLVDVNNQYYCINVDAYEPLENAFVTIPSVTLEIVDADQGVIRIVYAVDPIHLSSQILPSKVANNPNGDIRNPMRGPISMDSVCAGQTPPRLSPDFKMCCILTAVPASPNTEQQLHSIVVTPNQAEQAIGCPLGRCDGPDLEIFIGPQTCTAKIQWLDGRSTDIEKCFGIGLGEPNLAGMVLNESVSSPTTGAALNNVALAAAVQVYATLIDRPQGTQAGHIRPGVPIKGYIEEVRHDLSGKGVALTHVTLPGHIQPLSLAAYLDPSSRAAIFHLVQPAGAS